MVDPNILEDQLNRMIEAVEISFNELNKTDPSTINQEQIKKKAKEIISLSRSLDQSIDECNYLSLSKEKLDEEMTLQFEEKKKKLDEFMIIYNQAG